jgi:hypothetical protein
VRTNQVDDELDISQGGYFARGDTARSSGLVQPPRGTGDTGQDSPLPPGRLDPLADRHPPIVPTAFRKLDAVAVLTGPLLPAPLEGGAG